MARLVMKFGGTSVGSMERIHAVAQKVKKTWEEGHEVAVVLSAMSGQTNKLVEFCAQTGPVYDAREYDVVVATGEQVTVGLLAMALQSLGVPARSWLGWQLPIYTSCAHGKAQIEEIEVTEIQRRFGTEREVAVVAGFQGIAKEDNRITTLGRGGSDTSAVALAAALKADRCDIYTDVDGVYTTDPRIAPKASKLNKISFEEMLELASLGAKVLQTRSVSMAMRHNVCLQVLSSFEDKPGTFVVKESEIMERNIVNGIAYTKDEAKISLYGIPDRPGVAAKIFGPLAQANVNVDMIVQSTSPDGKETNLTFTVPHNELAISCKALEVIKEDLNCRGFETDENVVKISVVGLGMRSHAGVAQTLFAALSEKGINIHAISTSEIKVSVLISADYLELAVRHLHTIFGLDAVQE